MSVRSPKLLPRIALLCFGMALQACPTTAPDSSSECKPPEQHLLPGACETPDTPDWSIYSHDSHKLYLSAASRTPTPEEQEAQSRICQLDPTCSNRLEGRILSRDDHDKAPLYPVPAELLSRPQLSTCEIIFSQREIPGDARRVVLSCRFPD